MIEYPVLRLDLNADKYENIDGLKSILTRHLRLWEERFGSANSDERFSSRF
jgi:hypothetical protein